MSASRASSLGARPDDVAAGGGGGILRTAETRGDLVDLGTRLVDRRLADGGDLDRELSVVLQQRKSLPRQRVEPAQSLLHTLQREGGAPGGVDGLRTLLSLQRVDAQLQLLGLVLQHQTLGVSLLLVARMVDQLCPKPHEVVGEQPRLGVTHDSRDRGGLPRDLRLLAERLQLSTQLPREVAEPREVRLHRLELAERLLLAATVLENAGGLLDEAAAVLGARLQHAVQAPLTHDDVHLAAEAGVAQQLLHVQQAAAVAVDRVLAGAVAEQRPADRDLGVLDRQRAVGVVDR
ncbi:hypothetical protein [Microbacterium aurum]